MELMALRTRNWVATALIADLISSDRLEHFLELVRVATEPVSAKRSRPLTAQGWKPKGRQQGTVRSGRI